MCLRSLSVWLQMFVSNSLFQTFVWKSDSLFDIVMELQQITQISIDANAETIIKWLTERPQRQANTQTSE